MREPDPSNPSSPSVRKPVISEEAIARAQKAVDQLSSRFDGWMAEEVRRLAEAWSACESADGSDATLKELHLRAHDLKGLGPTCGYPIIGDLGNEICRLTGPAVQNGDIRFRPDLIRDHTEAVQIALAAHIRTASSPEGSAMLARLAALRTLAR